MKHNRTIRILALIAVVGGLVTAGCQPPAPAAPPDYAAELRPVFDRFIEALNTQDYSKLGETFADDFRRVAPDFNADSRDEMIESIARIHAAYPDFHIVIGDSAYSKDRSFNQWTVTATSTTADGSKGRINVVGVSMLRYSGGRITEEWVYFDTAQITKPLGTADMPHTK